jgi:hypothetical protein
MTQTIELKKETRMLRKIFNPLLVVFVALASLAACGAPTVESQIQRYKRAVDQLDLLASKMPQHKFDIERKKVEFSTEFETLKTKTGDEAARALAGLCSRVEQFEAGLNPQAVAAPAGTTTPGGKLGGPADPGAAGQPVQPAAGGKLGGAVATPPGQPQPAPGGSGFGGGAAPVPTPAPAPQPQGGSGFGGGAAPAPTPAPAPAPAPQPQGGSGFGGQ